MTINDLLDFLQNTLRISQREAAAAAEVTAKIAAFKYEAELYKVFTEEDIHKANTLSASDAQAYLHARYLDITGERSDNLLTKIIDEVVSAVMQKPQDYFRFSNS